MSVENQLVAFRRVIWTVSNYHKILWKSQQSEVIKLKIGNLTTRW